jgi:hypothetical protein
MSTPIQISHERDERVKRLSGKLDRVLVDAPVFRPGHLAAQPGPEMATIARRPWPS